MKSTTKYLSLSIIILTLYSCMEKEVKTDSEVKTISDEELLRVPFVSTENNAEKDFFLYLPKGYRDQPDKNWPIILFLHGDGERGDSKEDLGFVLKHGPLYEAWVQRKDIPFIIVSPQLPLFGRDTLGIPYLVDRKMEDFPDRMPAGTPPRIVPGAMTAPMTGAEPVALGELRLPPNGWEQVEEDLLQIIDTVLTGYNTDPTRLYLTGLSYGGFGTWYLASKHPDLFAAIAPVVGWGHPNLMRPLAETNLPIWVFSGGRDGVVEKKFFTPGLNQLESLGHKNLRYTIHEDMGHDTWIRVYTGDDLYQWFLENSRN